MDDAQTSFRPEARNPRGFGDRRARDLRAERAIVQAVAEVYEAYGFEALDTPAFEYADALGKFLPDADRPNEGVFALQDDPDSEGHGQWMALRYDLTAPLARFAAQTWETLPKPFRRYAYGPVWRNEKPGPGRFREFIQCDADTVGSARPEADAEIIAMAVQGLEAAGIPRGNFVVNLNNRKLLDGLLDVESITSPGQRLAVLRAIDKYDKFGWEGVKLLLGSGRIDESGAFTMGAQISNRAIEKIEIFFAYANSATLDRSARIQTLGNLDLGVIGAEGLRELSDIDKALNAMCISSYDAQFNPVVVRGLEYYTGAVFEAELLLSTVDEKGQTVRFGSIGGGGRYDDLVARFTGQKTPATGFSFGVSRLAAALRAAGRSPGGEARGPVVIIAFSQDDMAEYFKLAGDLRGAGIPAEVYLGASGMKAQMKYADRRGAPAVVMMGGDELAAGTVTIKDLDQGRALAGQVTDNAAWKSERPGQATVPRAEMVAFIQRIVAGK
jgi:histidyl-tRNA synthetase